MLLGILTLLTALSISAVAIYYSVAGLMTIFAAAAIPIMIMGGVLEVGKLVTAVWLHRYWKQATWWLKTYLTTAVVVLMFITSMGIFGFLSKAHIEQTSNAQESVAQIERIETQIAQNETIIQRAEEKIEELETSGTGASAQIQQQIDREQERINRAYQVIQPAIDEQNAIIEQQTSLFERELQNIDAELQRLQNFIDNDEIERAQAMVGTAVDGDFGPNTARAFQEFQDRKAQEREQWLQRIQEAQQNDIVLAAREEIRRLRGTAEDQIEQSNILINNLRQQLKSDGSNSLQTMLDEQNDRIRTASSEIDSLLDTKFEIEANYRALEAEVGPVKYIAEFIYGSQADKNLLEEAVRWVIIVIIFVFDPLAVLLLIAAQYTFEFNRKRKDDGGDWLRQYEQSRAQRIVDNPGYDSSLETLDEEKGDAESRKSGAKDNGRNSAKRMAVAGEGIDVTSEKESTYHTKTDVRNGSVVRQDTTDQKSVSVEQKEDNEQIAKDLVDWDNATAHEVEGLTDDLSMEKNAAPADAKLRDMVPEDDVSVDDGTEPTVEQSQVQPYGLTADEVARDYTKVTASIEKKEIESSEGLDRLTEEDLELLEESEEWQEAKRQWKERHPNYTIKAAKEAYLEGKIDELPWEPYLKTQKKRSYIMKQGRSQIRKQTKD